MNTTNYTDTFIEVAEDSPAMLAQIPPVKEDHKTVAALQYEIIKNNPYQYTSDDVLLMEKLPFIGLNRMNIAGLSKTKD